MMKLDNKIALITGSDSGMGQAMAAEFARAGAHVGISYHTDKAGAEESRRRVEAAGKKPSCASSMCVTKRVSPPSSRR